MKNHFTILVLTFLIISCRNGNSVKHSGFDDLVIGSETITLYNDGKFSVEIGLGYQKGTYKIKDDTVILEYYKKSKLPHKFLLTDSVFRSINFEREITIKRTNNYKINKPSTKNLRTFNNRDNIEILSKINLTDYPSSDQDTSICIDWKLDNSQIKSIINNSKPITKSDWHYQFDHLPCNIIGKILQNEQEFEYSINAGAWFTIKMRDTSLIFGSFNSENSKYFLSEPWIEE